MLGVGHLPRKAEPVSIQEILLDFEKLAQQTAISPGIDNYKPHASQERFHRSVAKEKLYIGGNRSGKTVGGGSEAAMWLTGKHRFRTDLPKPPVRGRVVTVDIEDGIKKIVIPEVQRWIPREFLINGKWSDSYDKSSRTLHLTNGSFLEFMSHEQDVEKFAGTSRHFVWFDEEPPEDIFNECLMRLVDTGGSYWITMTPLIEMSWTKDRIYDPWAEGDDSIFVLEVNTQDNPHIDMSSLERLTRNLSEEERAARTSGTYINRTGLVYPATIFSPKTVEEGGNVLDDFLMAPPIWRTMRNYEHFIMMDHGLHNPCVFLFACYDTDGRIIVYDEIYSVGNLVRDNARIVKNRIDELGLDPMYIVGDPSIKNRNAVTGTSVQTEYAEHGLNISLGNNDVLAGIARVQNRCAKKLLYVTRRCQHLLKEFNNYRWDRYASKKIEARRNAKEGPLKRNDHCLDALRYGVCSSPAMEGEIDMPMGNVLGSPVALSEEFDWDKMFTQEANSPARDFVLGSEW